MIETMAVMSIVLAIMLILGKGIIEIEKLTSILYEEKFIENKIRNIKTNLHEYLTRSNNLYYGVENNRLQIYISIEKFGEMKIVKDELFSINEKLYLSYYREENNEVNNHTVMIGENIKKFEIFKKEKIIHLNIKVGEEEIYVCI